MKRKRVDVAKMQSIFEKAHEEGARFGGVWLMANRQVIRACEEVGLSYTDPQMKAMLSLAALNVLENVKAFAERAALEREGRSK